MHINNTVIQNINYKAVEEKQTVPVTLVKK